jgi:uncharacterized membrane protein
MRPLRFFFVIVLILCAADAVMIPLVMRPMFKAALGAGMLDELRLWPAALFYLIHAFGLTWFVRRASNPSAATLDGAIIGLVSYSCYEMTSWTIMRDWSLQLVIVDLAWGIALSAMAAGLGCRAVKSRNQQN